MEPLLRRGSSRSPAWVWSGVLIIIKLNVSDGEGDWAAGIMVCGKQSKRGNEEYLHNVSFLCNLWDMNIEYRVSMWVGVWSVQQQGREGIPHHYKEGPGLGSSQKTCDRSHL